MVTKRDFYDVLGIDKSASEDDIRKAFRRLAFQFHPDRNPEPGAEEKFKEINEAYEILSDSEKRAAYDRYGHAGVEIGGRGFDGMDPFAGFGDIFDAFFGGATRTRQTQTRGRDLRYDLAISFEEAVFGCSKEIEVSRVATCSACRGSGSEPGSQPAKCTSCNGSGELRRVHQSLFGHFVNVVTCDRCRGEGKIITEPCKECKGAGQQRSKNKVAVDIPAGVDEGAQIRLSGYGDAGHRGGPAGHLYIVVSVEPHQYFQRRGNDILYTAVVNFAQAALGDEVEVPTLDGPTKLKVATGTQTGRRHVLKGKGVPHLNQNGRGDEIVTVFVETPEHLTEQQKKLLKQFADTLGTPSDDHQKGMGFFDKLKDALG